MSSMVKPIGHGLFLAGLVLISLYLLGLYVRGSDALSDALDPLSIKTYLVLLPLTPGALLLWWADYTSHRNARRKLRKMTGKALFNSGY